MVGPADVQHAARCAVAWHFHQADPDHDDVDPDAAQRRIGVLMSRVRSRRDPITQLWLPVLVVLAAAAAALAQFLLQERSVLGYIVIVTALVLLQCSAALLTLQWADATKERRFREAMGPIPTELGGELPHVVGPVQDPEWGLEGRVGTVVHVGDHAVPVVAAEGRSGKDADPWHALRVGASLRLLEIRDGRAPEYGLVTYEDGVFRVAYDDVRGPLRVLLEGLRDHTPPEQRDHEDRRRCRTCPWEVGCTQSLV